MSVALGNLDRRGRMRGGGSFHRRRRSRRSKGQHMADWMRVLKRLETSDADQSFMIASQIPSRHELFQSSVHQTRVAAQDLCSPMRDLRVVAWSITRVVLHDYWHQVLDVQLQLVYSLPLIQGHPRSWSDMSTHVDFPMSFRPPDWWTWYYFRISVYPRTCPGHIPAIFQQIHTQYLILDIVLIRCPIASSCGKARSVCYSKKRTALLQFVID